MKTILAILVSLFGIICVSMILLFEHMGPDKITRSHIETLEWQIVFYFEEYHKLPDKLSDMRSDNSANKCLFDVWKHEIIYSKGADGLVTLASLGKSGKPGSKDAVVIRFRPELMARSISMQGKK